MKSKKIKKLSTQELLDLAKREYEKGVFLYEEAKGILDEFDSQRISDSAREIFLYVKRTDEKIVT